MCAPAFKDFSWRLSDVPPQRVVILTFGRLLASILISAATWSASSLVGQRTKAWSSFSVVSREFKIPSPKAAVLPEPVYACAIMFLPSNIKGRLCSWIGVIESNLRVWRFSRSSGRRGRVLKALLVVIDHEIAVNLTWGYLCSGNEIFIAHCIEDEWWSLLYFLFRGIDL